MKYNGIHPNPPRQLQWQQPMPTAPDSSNTSEPSACSSTGTVWPTTSSIYAVSTCSLLQQYQTVSELLRRVRILLGNEANLYIISLSVHDILLPRLAIGRHAHEMYTTTWRINRNSLEFSELISSPDEIMETSFLRGQFSPRLWNTVYLLKITQTL